MTRPKRLRRKNTGREEDINNIPKNQVQEKRKLKRKNDFFIISNNPA